MGRTTQSIWVVLRILIRGPGPTITCNSGFEGNPQMKTSRMKLAGSLGAIAIAVLGFTAPASAQTHSVTVATGVGVVLPYPGAYVVDPNVQISRDGGATWLPACAGDQDWGSVGYPFPLLVGPCPQSYGNPEDYRFRVTFTLPRGFTAPSLTGTVLSDDQTGAVIFNGTTLLSNPTGWGPWYENHSGSGYFDYTVTDASLFHCGENVLEYDVTNLGGVGGSGFTATTEYTGGTAGSCNPTPTELVSELLPIAEAIGGGSFSAQLKNVQDRLNAGNKNAALGSLNAFANHVKAQAGKKKISNAQAQQLLDAVDALTAAIGN